MKKDLKCIDSNENDDNNDIGFLMKRLVEILKELRSENGCPWDRKQTHQSLKSCLIEEAYEVIDAIERNNMEHLEEELGDLLLQVVFHSNLAEEKGLFSMEDVIQNISEKMIYRHPHVFSGETAKNADEALTKWENMKNKEKNNETCTESMRRIPKELPALIKSYKIQKKAANVGFDWNDITGAFEKVKEETEELLEIYRGSDKEKIKDEIGDLFFAVVNVARFLDIDPEEALNSTSNKFINRFEHIEKSAAQSGTRLQNMTLEEMDILWEEAKKKFNKI